MLTRLHVVGFKNLKDVDISFGAFTCIAGRNGVGKSNVFDVITFLSHLASMPLVKAATMVRGSDGRISGIESLFAASERGTLRRMQLIAEMVVPRVVTDDYDREAVPRATYLQYTIALCFDADRLDGGEREPIYIEREELKARNSSDAASLLAFRPGPDWIKRFVTGPGARKTPFIKTEISDDGQTSIYLSGDGRQGRPSSIPAHRSPQSVLSGVNSSTHPTVLAARREMQSWRLLQLEPSALRSPDEFRDESRVSATGRHLPNAVNRIGDAAGVAARLAELIPGIVAVDVDADDVRQLRTLVVTMKDRQRYAASSLSDGTLRFLALAVLADDPQVFGLVCLEEPENGIHPQRIPEMLRLVRSLADADEGDVADRQSLRQVIVNTHSPLVVAQLPEDELLVAETLRSRGTEWVNFKPLPGTWRAKGVAVSECITLGELETFLRGGSTGVSRRSTNGSHRVADHLTGDLFRGL